jgi:hypothetical protein
MNIQINKQSKTETELGTYKYYDLQIKTKRLEVVICPTVTTVTYHNASHKAWGCFLGKIFENIDKALNNYRDIDIISMLNFIKTTEINNEQTNN